jgi:hypothetical protein
MSDSDGEKADNEEEDCKCGEDALVHVCDRKEEPDAEMSLEDFCEFLPSPFTYKTYLTTGKVLLLYQESHGDATLWKWLLDHFPLMRQTQSFRHESPVDLHVNRVWGRFFKVEQAENLVRPGNRTVFRYPGEGNRRFYHILDRKPETKNFAKVRMDLLQDFGSYSTGIGFPWVIEHFVRNVHTIIGVTQDGVVTGTNIRCNVIREMEKQPYYAEIRLRTAAYSNTLLSLCSFYCVMSRLVHFSSPRNGRLFRHAVVATGKSSTVPGS